MTFPDDVKDYDFRNLMYLMLNKDLERRYCTFDEISRHIYFKDFNWDELISLNMEPPYKPNVLNTEYKYDPKPYIEYVKTLQDWVPSEDIKEPRKFEKDEFREWLDKF